MRNVDTTSDVNFFLNNLLKLKTSNTNWTVHQMKYTEKLKKRIDISDDPLFCEYLPLKKLKNIRLAKLNALQSKQQFQPSTIQGDEKNYSLDRSQNQIDKDNDQLKMYDYIKAQNKEVQQIKYKQKYLNKSRILDLETVSPSNDCKIPQIEAYFYRKTMINILKKANQQKASIENALNNIENHMGFQSPQPSVHHYIDLGQLQQNTPSQKIQSIRARSTRRSMVDGENISRQIEQNRQLRTSKQQKVQEIINKSEDIRDKSMEIKDIVFGQKPNNLRNGRKEIDELRKQCVRNLRDFVEINKKQQNQFINLLNHLRESEIKVTPIYQQILDTLRQKLLKGNEITYKEVKNLINDKETRDLGQLLCSFIYLNKYQN